MGRRSNLLVVLWVVVFYCYPILGSAESSHSGWSAANPCGPPNRKIKAELESGTIKALTSVVFAKEFPIENELASSYLWPPGKPPKSPKQVGRPIEWDQWEWGCRYGPGAVYDQDPHTAWVEGAKDDGIGEILMLFLGTKGAARELEIWAGFGKSERLFRDNNRPKNVRTHILCTELPYIALDDGDEGSPRASMRFENLRALGSVDAELVDRNGFQPLPLPTIKYDAVQTYKYCFVGIQIISVYPGSKFRDTAISEIRQKPGSLFK